MQRFQEHAERFETAIVFDHIHQVDLSKRPFTLTGDSGTYTCDSADHRHRRHRPNTWACPRKRPSWAAACPACATCDGFFYRNQDVCVVGGGNTAVEEALYLSNIASKVTLIHRRDKFPRRAHPDRQAASRRWQEGKIELKTHFTLRRSAGRRQRRDRHPHPKHAGRHTPKTSPLQGCFIAIGHAPNTDIFKGQLEMENGYIVTQGGLKGFATQTSVPGVFAAGDVQDDVYRQAITSAGTGCMAALDAQRFLEQNRQLGLRQALWGPQSSQARIIAGFAAFCTWCLPMRQCDRLGLPPPFELAR